MEHNSMATLQLAQRCMGPPSSPILGFRHPELPLENFIAYGAGPTTVVVQQIQGTPTGRSMPPPPLVLELRLPDSAASEGARSDTLDFIPTEPISQVAWCSAGTSCLLAAAAGEFVAIFSLDRFFKRLLEREEAVEALAPAASLSHIIQHSSAIVAMSWTQAGDGLLVSGKAGECAMYELPEEPVKNAAAQNRPIRLKQIWSGAFSTVTEPQALVSAGSHCWAPAATGQPGSRSVTVWWPPAPPKPASKTQSSRPPSSGAAASPSGSSQPPVPQSSADFSSETLRILEKVGGSRPAAEARQSTENGTGGGKAQGKPEERPRDWTIAEQLRHPAGLVGLQWSPGSLQRGHHQSGHEEGDPTCMAPSSQPALLTVTADGIIRIWVEVTLTAATGANPLNPATASPAQPGLPGGSHVCVTLVIQPPAGVWSSNAPRGLRAAWGAPEGGPLALTGSQIRATKVLWIAAVALGTGTSGEDCEKMLVWAVDGLNSVVLGSFGGASGGRPQRAPRAVLWGQHAGQLSWAGSPQAPLQLSVTVAIDADAPTLHVFESHQDVAHGTGEFRTFRVDTVEDEPLSPMGPPSPAVRNYVRHLPLHDYAAYELMGHAGSIQSLAAHRHLPLAVTLDSGGPGLLWGTDALAPEQKLPALNGQEKLTAVTWLDAGNPQQQNSLVLVAASSSAFHIFRFHHWKAGLVPEQHRSLPLPVPGFTVRALHTLEHAGQQLLLAWMTRTASAGPAGTQHLPPAEARDLLALWTVSEGQESQAGMQLDFVAWQQAPGDSAQVHSLATTMLPGVAGVVGTNRGGLHVLRFRDGQSGFDTMEVTSGGIGEHVAVGVAPKGGHLAAGYHSGATVSKHSLRIWEMHGRGACRHCAELPLSDSPSSLVWLDAAYPAQAVAVGLQTRSITLFARDHAGTWQAFAQLMGVSLPAPLLSGTAAGGLIAASGNQLCGLAERLQLLHPASDSSADGEAARQLPLARLLHESSGARPEWHPDILKLLVSRGRLPAAAAALRALLVLSKQGQNHERLHSPSLPAAVLWDQTLLQWASQLAQHSPASAAERTDGRKNGTAATAAGSHGPASAAEVPVQPSQPSAADPFAFDMSAFRDSAAAAPAERSQQAADSFAFDMAAFGEPAMIPAADSAGAQGNAVDPYAFDMGAFGEDSAQGSHAAESRAQVAADPFAFDAGAFQEPQPQQDPYAFNLGAFEEPGALGNTLLQGSLRQSQPPADPFAFDMEAFEDPSSSISVPQQPAGQPQADPFAFDMGAFSDQNGPGSNGSAQPDVPGSGLEAANPPEALRQPKHGLNSAQSGPRFSSAQLQKLARAVFRPLTTGELTELSSALGLTPEQPLKGEEDEEEKRAALPAAYGVFGAGESAKQAAETVVRLAELLSSGQPGSIADAPALDAAAQHTAASVQLAVLERGTSVEEEPTTSGRPFQQPQAYGGAAAHGSWSEQHLGLAAGLGKDAVLWALLSDSHEALLSLCAASVTSEATVGRSGQPKYDVTSKGHKTLDLGFRSSRTNLSAPISGALTWEVLRKVGAGFWLRDSAAVRQHAEALAKARFADTKDPTSCALFYAALGRKSLLQGLFRSANQPKQADFLARDFSQQKHREAACKNAFVLLGQHRHELAAAFFVLGGSARDAVGVCAHEMGDPQLALFLCHLLERPQGPLQRELLTRDLLPDAQEAGDGEAAAVIHWLLGDYRAAVQSLLEAPRQPLTLPPAALCRQAGRLELLQMAAAALPGVPEQLAAAKGTIATLAESWARALDIFGAPGLALEALTVADCLSDDPEQLRGPWKQALAHRTLLRHLQAPQPSASEAQLLGAKYSAVAPQDPPWRQPAVDEIAAYKAAGCNLDPEAVLGLLQSTHCKLWQPAAVARATVATEPGRPSYDSSRTSSRNRSVQNYRQGRAPEGGKIFGDGYELLRVDGDKLHDVCVCNSDAGDWGTPSTEWRPLVAASGRHGLVEGELAPPRGASDELISSATSESSHKGSTFTALLSEMLDAMRWPPDPWTMVAPLPGATVGAAAAPREGPSLSNSPSHRVNHIATATLAAHPYRPLYLSGSATGEIYLWQFGRKGAVAGYTPLPASSQAPPASPTSLFSSSARSWNPTPGVPFSHWGQPQSVKFSECGERFAAIGEGGVVAAWRVDAPRLADSDTGALGRADWCHQGLTKRGVDVTYVGGSTSVLVVGGFCQQGGNIVIWDTLAPPTAGPIARLFHHPNMVTSLQAVPGGCMLLSADETGQMAAVDLRMVGGGGGGGGGGSGGSGGGSRRSVLWQARNPAGGVTRMTTALRPSDGCPILVSGSRTGMLGVWSIAHGQLLQSLAADSALEAQAPKAKGRGLFSDALRGKPAGNSPVTGVVVCPEGLVSCNLRGSVHLHPLSSNAQSA